MSDAPHPNAALIERLYAALDAHDGDAMARCYADDASFEDPAFGRLTGSEVGDMWSMLAGRSSDLRVELLEHEADDSTGTAHWLARYTFARTGRPVVNDVRATFRFAGGRIVEHRDDFDLRRWARQALGRVGVVLGLTPLLGRSVRRLARRELAAFQAGSAR